LRVSDAHLKLKENEAMDKLKSRKLWVALGTLTTVILGAFQGTVSWDAALPTIAAIAIGYCVSQGWVDAAALKKSISEEASEDGA